MRIIEMKASKSGEYFKVWLDSGDCVRIETETAVKFHLKNELTLDDEKWDEVIADNSYVSARRRALNILGYHAVSRKQLFDKLCQKGADEETAERVVERMCELGLVDDRALLEEKVRQLSQVKKYGTRRIVSELTLKGFDREDIVNALDELEPDDFSAVCEIIEKKYAQTLADGEYSTRQKVTAALMRRGFDYDTVRSAIAEYTN